MDENKAGIQALFEGLTNYCEDCEDQDLSDSEESLDGSNSSDFQGSVSLYTYLLRLSNDFIQKNACAWNHLSYCLFVSRYGSVLKLKDYLYLMQKSLQWSLSIETSALDKQQPVVVEMGDSWADLAVAIFTVHVLVCLGDRTNVLFTKGTQPDALKGVKELPLHDTNSVLKRGELLFQQDSLQVDQGQTDLFHLTCAGPTSRRIQKEQSRTRAMYKKALSDYSQENRTVSNDAYTSIFSWGLQIFDLDQ